MSNYNLYLRREPLALNVPKSHVEVLLKGSKVIYKEQVYGVNGVHHFGGDLNVGLYGPISTMRCMDARQEHIEAGYACTSCGNEWYMLEDGSYSLRHECDCPHMAELIEDMSWIIAGGAHAITPDGVPG